jgi:hypothetical protein
VGLSLDLLLLEAGSSLGTQKKGSYQATANENVTVDSSARAFVRACVCVREREAVYCKK